MSPKREMVTVRNGNVISVAGHIDLNNFRYISSEIYKSVKKLGYPDVVLDFSNVVSAHQGAMIALCARINGYRECDEIDFSLNTPIKPDLKNLFINCDWAHFIDPNSYEKSKFKSKVRVKCISYRDGDEQSSVVNSVLDAILAFDNHITRQGISALEWAINEITDNVIVHSRSKIGGFVQLSVYSKDKSMFEFVVCDCGIGIPQKLRTAHQGLNSDAEVLDRAIREGVTSGEGMGNGLFGTCEICKESNGMFFIASGNAHLYYNSKDFAISSRYDAIPFDGTLVVAGVNCSDHNVLDRALRFGGKPHHPVDYLENKYEDDSGNVVFMLEKESLGFGTRYMGAAVRTKMVKISELCSAPLLIVDFSGVPVMSSSYADEVFGKIYEAYPKLHEMIRFANIDELNKKMIFRALHQRKQKNIELS